MQKFKLLAVAFAAVIALNSVKSFANVPPPPPIAPVSGYVMGGAMPWWIFVCPGGIIAAGMMKNWRRHKELTAPEAWTCGFLYWWKEGTAQYGR